MKESRDKIFLGLLYLVTVFSANFKFIYSILAGFCNELAPNILLFSNKDSWNCRLLACKSAVFLFFCQ